MTPYIGQQNAKSTPGVTTGWFDKEAEEWA